MKQLTCEVCGSNDLIKQDGVFVCQVCGCKYSLEEVRKMLLGDNAAAPAAPKVDNTSSINNYLEMARNALESSNNTEAENYANKIIELDPKHSHAWEIKGEAAGWQSRGNNNRMGEAVNAWLNAINYAAADDLDDIRERIANKYVNLFMAMLSLRTGNFGKIHDADTLNSTLADLKSGIEMMNTLMTKGGVSFNRGPVYTEIARKLNGAACDGYKDAKENFGPNHNNMAKWQWERFTASCDNCVKMLEKAYEYCKDNKLGQTICDNMVVIAEDARDSCSWKFNVDSWNYDNYDKDYSFTSQAKETRTKSIQVNKGKKEFFSTDQIAKVLDQIQGARIEAETERGRKAFWADHAELKESLDTKRKAYGSALARKEEELENLESYIELTALVEKIQEMLKKKSSMGGLFMSKEKKALQAQIDALILRRKELEAQVDEERNPIESVIGQIKAKIEEIDAELNKDRGRIADDNNDNLIPGAIKDGKFTVTPQQLADHLAQIFSDTYEKVEVMEGSSGFTDFGHQVRIEFYNDVSDEKKVIKGIKLFCTADDKDSPIQNIILEGPYTKSSGTEGLTNWAIVGAAIFTSLFKDMNKDDAEKMAVRLRYSGDRTLWTQDGMRFEYAGYEGTLLGLITITYDAMIIRPSKG